MQLRFMHHISTAANNTKRLGSPSFNFLFNSASSVFSTRSAFNNNLGHVETISILLQCPVTPSWFDIDITKIKQKTMPSSIVIYAPLGTTMTSPQYQLARLHCW
nr:hypothetical protein [Crucivirus sp.]